MDLHRGGEELASLQVLKKCPVLLSPCKPWAQALAARMAADSSNQMTEILRQTSQNTMACESLLRGGKPDVSGRVGKSAQHLAGERRELWVEMLTTGARLMKKRWLPATSTHPEAKL